MTNTPEPIDAKTLLEVTTAGSWEWVYALADCAVLVARPRGSENLSEYICLQSEKDADHLVSLLNSLTTRAETAEAEVERLRGVLQQFVNGVGTGAIKTDYADETLAAITRKARALLKEQGE